MAVSFVRMLKQAAARRGAGPAGRRLNCAGLAKCGDRRKNAIAYRSRHSAA